MTSSMLIPFVVAAVAFRLATLAWSIRNERALRTDGGSEIGARNSRALAGAHALFYVVACAEGLGRDAAPDAVTWIGLGLYLFGAVVLVLVIRLLGRFWTVKLILARDHVLIEHPLFRWARHPNYYLNILPELVGFALTLHAFVTLLVGLPLYAIPLFIRIRQEEAAMGERFGNSA